MIYKPLPEKFYKNQVSVWHISKDASNVMMIKTLNKQTKNKPLKFLCAVRWLSKLQVWFCAHVVFPQYNRRTPPHLLYSLTSFKMAEERTAPFWFSCVQEWHFFSATYHHLSQFCLATFRCHLQGKKTVYFLIVPVDFLNFSNVCTVTC